MPSDPDQFDFFVSYARNDNANGWITRFIAELAVEHAMFAFDRPLKPFFDKYDIRSLDDWQQRIFNEGLAKSRLFVAFISPNYFASEWCRREWKVWVDTEIAKHILSAGAAPIYFVEVPGFVGKVPGLAEQATFSEQQVAAKIAELCGQPKPYDGFAASVAPVVRQMRDHRQITSDFVKPFRDEGVEALRRADLHTVLKRLAQDLDQRVQDVKRAAKSETSVPPYNKRFSGRLDELLALRDRLKDDRAGVISGVQGLGGIGKTELAFTYAHAFASAYPGGRFLIPCEGKTSLRTAAFALGDIFRNRIRNEERKTAETYFAAITACLRERLARLGHILLVLDNVTDPALLEREQTDTLTVLGPMLHLLATTRLAPPAAGKSNWLTLGELPDADALDLLEKHRPFTDDTEREAASRVVKRLGGFTLAVELVAAWLAAHPSTTYTRLINRLGLEDLEEIASDKTVELRRHNHERRLKAVLQPTLDGLRPAERRTMEYAALLPPDHVSLLWLRELVTKDFPELMHTDHLSDLWDDLWRRLVQLALLIRIENETSEPRMVRIHRLVQRQAAERSLKARRKTQTQIYQFAQGRPESEPLYRQALAEEEKTFGPDSPHISSSLNNLGMLLHHAHRFTEAELFLRRALVIDEAYLGNHHPSVARDLNNLATVLQATGRLSEAEPLIRRALSIGEASSGPTHPDVAVSLNNLASLLQSSNRLEDSEPLYRRVVDIYERNSGPTHPSVASALNNLAQLLQATGRLADAEPLYRRALAIDEQILGPQHPNVARSLCNLATLLQATNRLAEAEPLMRRALGIHQCLTHQPSYQHPDLGVIARNYACLLQATGLDRSEVQTRLGNLGFNIEIPLEPNLSHPLRSE